MLKVVTDVMTAMDRGQITLLGMFDLSAAFDTVDHAILLRRFISFHLLIHQQFHHQQQFQRVKADNKLLIGHNRVTLMFVLRKYSSHRLIKLIIKIIHVIYLYMRAI